MPAGTRISEGLVALGLDQMDGLDRGNVAIESSRTKCFTNAVRHASHAVARARPFVSCGYVLFMITVNCVAFSLPAKHGAVPPMYSALLESNLGLLIPALEIIGGPGLFQPAVPAYNSLVAFPLALFGSLTIEMFHGHCAAAAFILLGLLQFYYAAHVASLGVAQAEYFRDPSRGLPGRGIPLAPQDSFAHGYSCCGSAVYTPLLGASLVVWARHAATRWRKALWCLVSLAVYLGMWAVDGMPRPEGLLWHVHFMASGTGFATLLLFPRGCSPRTTPGGARARSCER
jgi:hypothetical protein